MPRLICSKISANTLCVKRITDYLQPSQKQTNFKMHLFTKNVFRLNIFVIYFPLKLIFFHRTYVFFWLELSLFIKRNLYCVLS